VTKRTDYLVFTNTSERAVWRCDDNSWQGASRFMCTKTPLFLLQGVKKKITFAKNPGNAFSDALQMSRFQKFAATASQKT